MLLIGAGELGSRHLQSLIKCPTRLKIFVVDNSRESLSRAKVRASEINNNSGAELFFLENMNDVVVPEFFLTIVATSSLHRLAILKEKFERFRSHYVILEKFLFPDLKSYAVAKNLIERSGSVVFVNCPLRTYPIFQEVKNQISKTDIPIIMEYSGGEWVGLGCNSIHYIDLLSFLSNSNLRFVDCSAIDSKIIPSKRQGYLEFTGQILCEYENGSRLYLQSIANSEADSKIVIRWGRNCYEIDELSGNFNFFVDETLRESGCYPLPYQSELTHKILDELICIQSCGLSSFDCSSEFHKIFLTEMLRRFNEIQDTTVEMLPIT